MWLDTGAVRLPIPSDGCNRNEGSLALYAEAHKHVPKPINVALLRLSCLVDLDQGVGNHCDYPASRDPR